jgi:hypothetical protein
MKFRYTLTKEAQNRIWAETGKKVWGSQVLEIPDEETTPEQRQKFLAAEPRFGEVTLGSVSIDSYSCEFRHAEINETLTPGVVWQYLSETLADRSDSS